TGRAGGRYLRNVPRVHPFRRRLAHLVDGILRRDPVPRRCGAAGFQDARDDIPDLPPDRLVRGDHGIYPAAAVQDPAAVGPGSHPKTAVGVDQEPGDRDILFPEQPPVTAVSRIVQDQATESPQGEGVALPFRYRVHIPGVVGRVAFAAPDCAKTAALQHGKPLVAAQPDPAIAGDQRLQVEVEVDIVPGRAIHRALQRIGVDPCGAVHRPHPDISRPVLRKARDHVIGQRNRAVRLVLQEVYVRPIVPEEPGFGTDPQEATAVPQHTLYPLDPRLYKGIRLLERPRHLRTRRDG